MGPCMCYACLSSWGDPGTFFVAVSMGVTGRAALWKAPELWSLALELSPCAPPHINFLLEGMDKFPVLSSLQPEWRAEMEGRPLQLTYLPSITCFKVSGETLDPDPSVPHFGPACI